MACGEYTLTGGMAKLVDGTRRLRAALIVRDEAHDADPPTDPARAAAVAAAGFALTGADPPALGYDDVDAYLDCAPAQYVVDHWKAMQSHTTAYGGPEGNREDVCLRLHYARQSFRWANRLKWSAFVERVRADDHWPTLRLGLAMFSALRRIDYSADRQAEYAALYASLVAAGVAGDDRLAAFAALNATLSIPLRVVPTGCGPMQAVLNAIETADVRLWNAVIQMGSRLPKMPIPGYEPPPLAGAVRGPCIACPDCPSATC